MEASSKDILLWLKAISNRNNIKKRLSYGNVSLWWFYEFGLTYLVKNLLKNKKYKYRHNIFIECATKLPRYYYLYLLITITVRFVLGKLFKSRSATGNIRDKILAVSYVGYWNRVPVTQRGSKILNQDSMLGSIITALRNSDFAVLALDRDFGPLVNFKTMIEKNTTAPGLWKAMETYLTLDIIRTALDASRRHRREWSFLKNNEKFINSLNYGEIHFFDLLKDEFRKIFEQRTFEAVLFIEVMRRAIKIEKPSLILTIDEYDLSGRAAVIAGKLEGVPTLAIQHGNISPDNAGYVHTKDEISDEIAPKYCPLATKTAVYGPWVKKVLVEDCNYPEDSVAVTGQARYDFLAKADKIFSREEFCERCGLDPDKKIALVCTQPLPVFEERIVFLRSVLRALGEFSEIQVVIKPHPNEEGKWYEELAKEQEAKVLILAKRSDTYEAIYACDVMLAFFSTTITEALILNKPVVVVNLTGEPDPVPYVESGSALGAYREEDIEPAIRKALYDENTRGKLGKARVKFVHEHCYKIDGKASERVVRLIEEMIEKSRNAKNET